MHDGGTVRISSSTAFEPDALVYRGPRLPREVFEVPEPVIVIEVLSEATAERDHGLKLSGYFSTPSVAHYLILDPERRTVVHHERGKDGASRRGPSPTAPCGSTRPGSRSSSSSCSRRG